MAAAVYPKAQQTIADAGLNLSSAPIRALLVNSSQAYSSAHQYVSDLTGADIIQRAAVALSSVATTSGVFTAANYTFGSANGDRPPSSTPAAIVIYHYTGTDSTSDLLAWLDGLSTAVNGSQDYVVSWNASGIFAV